MSRKNHQAVRTKELHANKQAKQRFLLRVTYLILILSLVSWGWSMLRNPSFFPLKQVEIRGQYKNTNPQEIKAILQPYLNIGLLRLNTTAIQQQLEELPWVQTAEISRDWPNKLIISLTQKVPLAHWHKKALITADGSVFFPPVATIPNNLPYLETPSLLIPQGIIILEQMNHSLARLNLQINKLIFTERQAVTLVLQSTTLQTPPISFKLLLGHNDIQERFNRFTDVFPKVFENRLNQVQYVDMRYTNGMAVKWKTEK